MTRYRPNALLLALVVGSMLVGAYDALVYWHDVEPVSVVSKLWPFVFAVLVAMWLEADSRGRPEIDRPFEFSYLLFFIWLPYLPYYLWRTRGRRGLMLLVGFLVLAFLSQLFMGALHFAS